MFSGMPQRMTPQPNMPAPSMPQPRGGFGGGYGMPQPRGGYGMGGGFGMPYNGGYGMGGGFGMPYGGGFGMPYGGGFGMPYGGGYGMRGGMRGGYGMGGGYGMPRGGYGMPQYGGGFGPDVNNFSVANPGNISPRQPQSVFETLRSQGLGGGFPNMSDLVRSILNQSQGRADNAPQVVGQPVMSEPVMSEPVMPTLGTKIPYGIADGDGSAPDPSFQARMAAQQPPPAAIAPQQSPINAYAFKKGGFVAKPVWDKKRPKDLGEPKSLSVKKKKSAKARAAAAGRPYPNLIDNMAAARKKGK